MRSPHGTAHEGQLSPSINNARDCISGCSNSIGIAATMLVTIVLFAVVFTCLACGANIRALPVAPSCLKTGGLQSQSHFECTTSIDWVGDGYNNEDCRATVQRLYTVEVTKHHDTEFEFLSPGAMPYTSNPVMQTPRRYSVGQS